MEVRRTVILALFATLTTAACSVGEYGTGGETATTPDAAMTTTGGQDETSFNMMVKPLAASNGCTGCHGAQAPTLTSWDMLQAKYKTKSGAMILATKGAHQGSQYFNQTDLATVQSWINGLSQ